MKASTAFIALAGLLAAGSAKGQTLLCDSLEPADKARITELFARLKPYECCDDTFAKCLAAPKPCPMVVRQADSLCRMASYGKEVPKLEEAYQRRKKSMTGQPPALTFSLDESARLGEPKAPVTIVVYACTRCPFCRDVILSLHREVTEDNLKGIAKVYLRPFPLKSHEGSTEGALALLAAGAQGRMWDYAVYTYKHFDQFHPSVLADWASFLKLDKAAFEKAMADDKLREVLTELKKEGVRNKVEATPMLFIDGRPYSGDMDSSTLVDVVTEEHQRVTAKK